MTDITVESIKALLAESSDRWETEYSSKDGNERHYFDSREIVEWLLKENEELIALNSTLLRSNDRDKQAWAISFKDLELALENEKLRFQAAIDIAIKYLTTAHLCAWNETGIFKTEEVRNKATKLALDEIQSELQRLKSEKEKGDKK